MKELVEFIARSLVDHPDEVDVREVRTNGGLVVELRVNPEDLGVVIGRKGRTATALRLLLAVAAEKKQCQPASLEILD